MAPYISDKQRRYFHYAEKAGKIKPSTVKEFDKASKGMDLPEKVAKKRALDKIKKGY